MALPDQSATFKFYRETLPRGLRGLLFGLKLYSCYEVLRYLKQNKVRILNKQDPVTIAQAIILLRQLRLFMPDQFQIQSVITNLLDAYEKPAKEVELNPPLAIEKVLSREPVSQPSKQEPQAKLAKPNTEKKTNSPRKKKAAKPLNDAEFTKMMKSLNLPSQYKDACPICQVVYRLDKLSNHIQTAHGILIVNCKYCGIRVSAGNLANHLLRRHHGELGDVHISTISKIDQDIRIPIQPPPAADGPADTDEFFFRAMPPEVLSRLESSQIQNIPALLSFLEDHWGEISQNSGLFFADEAVLMLRRLRSLGVFDTRVVYLLRDLMVSLNYKLKDGLYKPRRFKCACPACGGMYAIEWLNRHVILEHSRELLQCPFCSKKLGPNSLCNHLSMKHHEKMLSVYARSFSDPKISSRKSAEDAPKEWIENDQPTQPPIDTPEASAHETHPVPFIKLMPPLQAEAPSERQLSSIRALRQVTRGRQARIVKIVSEVGDQTYLISQASRVKTERANQLHKDTLAALCMYLADYGVNITETNLIDAFAEIGGPNIFEIKSIDDLNEKIQIRHAVAQLYEYRFVYGLRGARLWLVLSDRPQTNWILEYLVQDREIAVLWFEDGCLSGPSTEELTNLLQM